MRRSFPREMSSLEQIVAYVREFLAREGLAEAAAHDLDLVLEELFTNLVKYGRGARGDVEISLERGASGVRAQLREFDAEPFDPTQLPEVDVRRPITERRPGGLGVHFVRELTQSFRYDHRDRVGVISIMMKDPSLQFDIRVQAGGRVELTGRLDAAQSERALAIFRSLSGPVTVDCAGLDYISSAGIAVFMDTYRRLSSAGHAFHLANLAPRVRNVLIYAGLDKLLGIE